MNVRVSRGALMASAMLFLPATTAPAFAQARWQLSAKPTLTIGDETNEKTQFSFVRAIVRGADGSVTVLNWGTRELRQFSATGTYVKSYGREGAGPGEFRNMNVSARNGDTLFISDSQLNRLTRFVIGKGFVGSSVLQPSVGPVEIIERLRDGDMFVHESRGTNLNHRNGIYRDSLRLGVMSISPTPTVRWIGNFSAWSYLAVNPRNAERAQSISLYKFGGNLMMASSGNDIIVGNSERAEIMIFSTTGATMRTFKLPLEQHAFNEKQFANAKADELAKAKRPATIGAATELYSLKYRPKYEPLYEGLHTALDGTVWVRRFRYTDKDPTDYLVINTTGKVIATITVRPRFAVQEIGADYVLGVSKDDDDAESVVMYAIRK